MTKIASGSTPEVRIDYRNNRVFLEGRSIDSVWNALSQLRTSQTTTPSTTQTTTQAAATQATPGRRPGHKMSPAARRKLSLAAKARYAQQQKKHLKTMAAGG